MISSEERTSQRDGRELHLESQRARKSVFSNSRLCLKYGEGSGGVGGCVCARDAEGDGFLPLSRRVLALAAVLGLVLWLSLDTAQRPEQLVSFGGICVFITLLFACSKHHRAVSV